MLKLLLDTSSRDIHIAFCDTDRILWQHTELLGRGEVLADLVLKGLEAIDQKITDISHCLVCVGPGSFTGLRTGLAFIQGLAFAQKLQIQKISALRLFATELLASGQKNIGVALLAQSQKWYIGQGIENKESFMQAESLVTAPQKPDLDPSMTWICDDSWAEYLQLKEFIKLDTTRAIELLFECSKIQFPTISAVDLKPQYLQESAAVTHLNTRQTP